MDNAPSEVSAPTVKSVPSNSAEIAVESVPNDRVAPSFETLFQKFMENIASGSASSVSATAPNFCVEAVPEFGGSDLGEDATKWCDLVEKITEKLSVTHRLSLATHALVGPAKKWYHGWVGNPRTWPEIP